ncbi:MAG: hypothetical protein RSC93_12280 [Erysipelotrichaceae bacterium]
MKEYKVDVPVLMIFFNRPKQLEKSFEAIRKAKPSKLYLYQDGPRDGNMEDAMNVKKCQDIVKNIDWNCTIMKKFQKENFGVDPSEFIAQKWMFSFEEFGIVLEDDDVPAPEFFAYCKELLVRFKDNTKINKICGTNAVYDTKYYRENDCSYFYSKIGSIIGWASWKRVVDLWDETYSFLDDTSKLEIMKRNFNNEKGYVEFIETAKEHRITGKAHYESIGFATKLLQGSYDVIPSVNLITNIGLTPDAAHTTLELKCLPRGLRSVYFKKTGYMRFPLIHNNNIKADKLYDKSLFRILGRGHPIVSIYRSIELHIYQGIYAESKIKYVKSIINKIKNKICS